MIGSTRTVRVWAYPEPTDMRKGFNGLSGIVSQRLGGDPLSGDCYLFCNRTRTTAKVLMWDGTGLCVYHKKLERGRFAVLWPSAGDRVELTASELSLYLEGCELVSRVSLSPKPYEIGPLGRLATAGAVRKSQSTGLT
jgi:transposase